MTADLTMRITEALDQAERLARAADTTWDGDHSWHHDYYAKGDEHWVKLENGATIAVCGEDHTMAPQHAAFIAANDPPTVLRSVAADRRVLERHAPFVNKEWVGVNALLEHGTDTKPEVRSQDGFWVETRCRGCEMWTNVGDSNYPWPCDDIRDLADRWAVGVTPDA